MVDLQQLTEALKHFVYDFDPDPTVLKSRYEFRLSESHGWAEWDGATECPILAFALRDAVRKVAPGSYCIPVPVDQQKDHGPMRVVLKNALGSAFYHGGRSSAGYFEDTETGCWGAALVSLNEAGLLSVEGA